jgi:hypothetical protein
MDVSYTLEFYNNFGLWIGEDKSGSVFSTLPFTCFGMPQKKRVNYGYRKTLVKVPKATATIRFIADYDNGFGTCYCSNSGGGFSVGFDNLFMEMVR